MTNENLNNLLDELFYKEKLGVGNKTTFIKNVRDKHPSIKVKDIQEYLKNQEVSQMNTTVNKKYEYKITAPPRTFQIDIFWWKKGESLLPILLLVDILSRKAYAYVLPKSIKEKRGDITVKTLEELKNEVGHINGLEGDNEFGSAAVKTFCDKYNIRLDSSVSKLEHISGGNKLGIIDRLVRTLRELIERYYDILGNRKETLQNVMDSIIATYNNDNHRSLQNKTPNQVFKDNDNQRIRFLTDSIHNQSIYQTIPFNASDQVRVLEDKGIFDKGKNKFSKETYTVDKKDGYKIKLEGTTRKFKPSELLKITGTVSNPVSKAYIEAKKEDKKAGKVISSLVRNAKMTPTEAKQAVKSLNDAPVVRSSRVGRGVNTTYAADFVKK